jgi:hypothetical protein
MYYCINLLYDLFWRLPIQEVAKIGILYKKPIYSNLLYDLFWRLPIQEVAKTGILYKKQYIPRLTEERMAL